MEAVGIVPVIIAVGVIVGTLIISQLSGIRKWFANGKVKKQKTELGEIVEGINVFLADIKTLKAECKILSDSLGTNKQEQLRQALHISEEQWMKICKHISIDNIVGKLNSDISVMKQLTSDRKELTSSGLLENASGGLALKGVLVTRDIEDCIAVRKTVIKTQNVVLKSPISPQKDGTIDFTSQIQNDHFHRSLSAMGFSIAKGAKEGQFVFQLQTTPSQDCQLQQSESEAFLSKEMYSYVPTAVCELDLQNLALSENSLCDLRMLERLLEAADNQCGVQERCEGYMRTYGSHVNVGHIEFGGIYQWQATFSGDASSNMENVHSKVQKALSGFVTSSLGVVLGGGVSGDPERAHAGLSSSDDEIDLSKMVMDVSKTGGPHEVTSLPLWKMGLIKCNDTWAVIDRGSKAEDFLGIWEIIRNNAGEFTDAQKLAETVQCAWQTMNGMVLESHPQQDKVEVAVNSLNEFLDKVVHWATDEKLPENAANYLSQLLQGVQECLSVTGDSDVWVNKLRTHRSLSDFLRRVMQVKDDYPPSDMTCICDCLRKLVELAQGHQFPLGDDVLHWVSDQHTIDVFYPDLMKNHSIQDIPSLIHAVRGTLLPALHIASSRAGSSDQVNLQVATDLTLAVDHLRVQLENADKQYDLFLLLVASHELGFDPVSKSLHMVLTEEVLTRFIDKFEIHANELQHYERSGNTKQQAFLVGTLVRSLQEQNSRSIEQDFQIFMRPIQTLLTVDVRTVLENATSSSPYQWGSLLCSLDDFCKVAAIQPETIGRSNDIYDSDRHNNHPEDHPATTSVPQGQTSAEALLKLLGLSEYYPSKISLQDVMTIGNRCETGERTISNVPWHILRKLIMTDFNGRDSELGTTVSGVDGTSSNACSQDDTFTLDEILSDSLDGIQETSLNALDVFLSLYGCCDMLLKQTLVQKMFLCRLAVPFIYPDIMGSATMMSLWALQSIIVEWKNKNQDCCHSSVVCQPMDIVSFLTIGDPSVPKSILLNKIISEQHHHTFWNKECPHGSSGYSLAKGLVEAQWYLPAGKATDTFKDLTMFLNLRGDASVHKREVDVLKRISSVMVCCLETTDLGDDNVLQTLQDLHTNSSKVVLVVAAKDPASLERQALRRQIEHCQEYLGRSRMDNTKVIFTFKGSNTRTIEDLKCELRNTLHKFISNQEKKSIQETSSLAKEAGFELDEQDTFCEVAKALAEEVFSHMEKTSTNNCKKEMLPLQGKDWQEWSKLQKDKHRLFGKDSESDFIDEEDHFNKSMTLARQNQLKVCKNISPLMQSFLQNLLEVIDFPDSILFMQYLKLSIDELSRDILPGLQRNYHKKWMDFSKSKSKSSPTETSKLKDELASAERMLAEASLGVEHLLREAAQMYEAGHDSKVELPPSMKDTIQQLPKVGAKLLLKGQPIEIMDGDAGNVPLTWVKAVFTSLKELVGDKKLFVISALGIQSSGKSTLLNTMFGLQFAVSAGRCTRGVYMQLIKVDKEKTDLPYDYVLVVDTEGLRAREPGHVKFDNDSQLATFVVGLGDVTMLNIKGENVAEVSNVLQIAVHAFLKMKVTHKKKCTCIFVHQNVPAINAREKMKHGCQELTDTLDKMTTEACAIEDIRDIQTFNEVIEFDSETNVWYISDLWHGDPPMAPVNPGYTEKVQEVKEFILYGLSQKQETFLTFSDMILRIQDLWKGVLSENFVFSFRNSLAAKAYSNLESIYHEKSWTVQNGVSEWVTRTAFVQLEKCQTPDNLEVRCIELLNDLQTKATVVREKAQSDLKEFFEGHNLKEILIEWKAEKSEGLNNESTSFLRKAERDIRQKSESLRIDLLHKTRKEQHDVEIMNKAKQLAHDTKGHTADEKELHAMFDQVWIQWMNEFAARTTLTTLAPIEQIVQNLLLKHLTKWTLPLSEELVRNPLSQHIPFEDSIQINEIAEEQLSINYPWYKRMYKRYREYFHSDEELALQCRQKALQDTNSILADIEGYLRDLQNQDTGFQESYATQVIKMVVDGVRLSNEKSKNQFTFKPDLICKIAVHACRYAVTVFKTMQQKYDATHSVLDKMGKYKSAAWSLFKNTVKQSEIEVTAAELLLNQLEVFLQDSVKKGRIPMIVNDILHNFSFQKYHLLVRILEELAESNFEQYESFLTNTKAFGLGWITQFTNKAVFEFTDGRTSKYAGYAEGHLSHLSQCIERSIKTATSVVMDDQIPCNGTWVKTFCEALEELPIKEDDLMHLRELDVQDFNYFQKLLIEWLPLLGERLLSGFKAERADSIKWEGTTPYKQILDRLWGCEARCPFCGEVCQKTDPNHLSPNDCHQCIQHRPSGITGTSWRGGDKRSGQLVVESCNFKVQCTRSFNCPACQNQCKNSGKCSKDETVFHPFKEYKTFLPDWDIAPSHNMESSRYWMWVMAEYKHELAERHNKKVPDVPEAWNEITKREALDSLRVYYN